LCFRGISSRGRGGGGRVGGCLGFGLGGFRFRYSWEIFNNRPQLRAGGNGGNADIAVVEINLSVAGTPGINPDAEGIGIADGKVGGQRQGAGYGGGEKHRLAHWEARAAETIGGVVNGGAHFAPAQADVESYLAEAEAGAFGGGYAVFVVSIGVQGKGVPATRHSAIVWVEENRVDCGAVSEFKRGDVVGRVAFFAGGEG